MTKKTNCFSTQTLKVNLDASWREKCLVNSPNPSDGLRQDQNKGGSDPEQLYSLRKAEREFVS